MKQGGNVSSYLYVKAIAEELELKPGLINKAITVAHKGNYKNIADDMDTLESILNTAGKL
mgnify:CR=1 FL=1